MNIVDIKNIVHGNQNTIKPFSEHKLTEAYKMKTMR